MARNLVVKLGGSVITDKTVPLVLRSTALRRILSRLFEAWSAARLNMVLVHGGGSFGHYAASMAFKAEGVGSPMLASIVQKYMHTLNLHVIQLGVSLGMPLTSVPPHAICGCDDGGGVVCSWDNIVTLLDAGAIPVTYGDAVPCRSGVKILSGDEAVVEVAKVLKRKVGPSDVLYLVDVDGVYDERGKLLSAIRLEELPEGWTAALRRDYRPMDVTGGMLEKLRRIKSSMRELRGTRICIMNGLRDEPLAEYLSEGSCRGTSVLV